MASIDTEDDQLLSVIYGDHEPDDWAAKHQISLSELASRLNAKQHFDNRGRQIWTDGAEEATVQWNVITVAGAAVARDITRAWRGAASVKFTTAANAGSLAQIRKRLYNPMTGRYGFEIAWSTNTPGMGAFRLHTTVYDGTNYYQASIAFRSAGPGFYWYNDLTAWVLLPIPSCVINDDHMWHKMKMVIDVNLMEYVRVMIDGYEIDLQGNAMNTGLSGLCQRINADIQLEGDIGGVYNVFVDDFIFTHLEP